MKDCTYRVSLDALLKRPMGLLALRGSDGEPDGKTGDPDANEADKKGDDDKSKSGDGDKDDKSGNKKAEPSPDEKRIAALEEEKQRFYDQREDVKKQLKAANDKIKQLEKDGTPDDALKTSNDTLTASNEKLVAQNQRLALENAFLKEGGYDWVDPSAALRLADLDAVEFDEKSGKAMGLGTALAKLAKESPYLLKAKEEDKDKDDKDGNKPAPRRTGQAPRGGTQKEADEAARQAKLRAKYPALRR